MTDDFKYDINEIKRPTFFDLVFFHSSLLDFWFSAYLLKDMDHPKDYEEFEVSTEKYRITIISQVDKGRNVVRIYKNSYKKMIKSSVFDTSQVENARDYIIGVIYG